MVRRDRLPGLRAVLLRRHRRSALFTRGILPDCARALFAHLPRARHLPAYPQKGGPLCAPRALLVGSAADRRVHRVPLRDELRHEPPPLFVRRRKRPYGAGILRRGALRPLRYADRNRERPARGRAGGRKRRVHALRQSTRRRTARENHLQRTACGLPHTLHGRHAESRRFLGNYVLPRHQRHLLPVHL